ncbi:GDP-mannose 4,6-dehydratase [Campylobacter jejuni subsp. doylei]|uniref:GDP-mannose 4,6-dehydratase n=1 Tax=Campylobacter jejuni subsp. doylei TaxID=32021 RepID=A0A3S4S2D7_CAMJU|nr:GDP-mannose 4,6-dehydratase [Campylobacter jejuni subsp. doylei]
MKKTALITGFTGQVGSQMADFLLKNTHYDVIGMMRWQEPMDNIYHLSDRINKKDRISICYADLNDYSSLQKLLLIYLIETLQTNIIGTANILENIRILKAKDGYDPVVHICSSSEVYGKAKAGVKLNEETAFHGASPYSISKMAPII